MSRNLFLSILLSMSLMGCASSPPDPAPEKLAGNEYGLDEEELAAAGLTVEELQSLETPESTAYDPFEGFNRAMWTVNYEYLDPYFLRPVSLAYVDYVPSPLRTGLRNFLSNLEEPANMLNSFLMQNPEKAVDHFNRFWINSIFGLGGLIDIASAADISPPGQQSFPDTLGYYGVGNGPYFMIPAYGPVTLREGAGDWVDKLYFPLNLLTFWQSAGKWALEGMENRAKLVAQEPMLNNSPDPYVFTRDAYIQYKNFRAGGEAVESDQPVNEDYLDDYLDEIDSE
ncbi:ABC transporter [Photobacterium galatheae]|uniref:ABC transporter n=2 Tax=Photobacterium galatheae TaxID=1654360 RepID=A0A066RRW2_9GAMM|nr:ABC transporter [Photobacterium galatheae]